MKKNSPILLAFLFVGVFLLSGCSDQKVNPASTMQQEPMKFGKVEQTPPDSSKLTTGSAPSSSAAQNETKATPPETLEYIQKYDGAVIHTTMGDIKVKFYNDDAPLTVNNFLKLSSDKFYDNTKFHRVIKDFMVQGGDPNSKDDNFSDDGKGGPGYAFKDEFNSHKLVKGSLAMANSGPNTNGSQFFIVTKDSTPWLDGKHTNFGQIEEGMDVVQKIEAAKTDSNDHPTENVSIKSIDLIEKK